MHVPGFTASMAPICTLRWDSRGSSVLLSIQTAALSPSAVNRPSVLTASAGGFLLPHSATLSLPGVWVTEWGKGQREVTHHHHHHHQPFALVIISTIDPAVAVTARLHLLPFCLPLRKVKKERFHPEGSPAPHFNFFYRRNQVHQKVWNLTKNNCKVDRVFSIIKQLQRL